MAGIRHTSTVFAVLPWRAVETPDIDPATRPPAEHYRDLALTVRALIPLMRDAQVKISSLSLALQYESLADGIAAVSDSLRTVTPQGIDNDSASPGASQAPTG
jgi:hypothetical protein